MLSDLCRAGRGLLAVLACIDVDGSDSSGRVLVAWAWHAQFCRVKKKSLTYTYVKVQVQDLIHGSQYRYVCVRQGL